jgi:Methyltransferase small domain
MGTNPATAVAPSAADVGLVHRFRTVLDEAGYGPGETRRLLGETIIESWELPLHLRRLPDEATLPTLFRLFLLGAPVTAVAATNACAPLSLDDLVALGMVRIAGDQVEPLVRIVIHNDILIASDGEATFAASHDHVSGVSLSSRTCLALTHRAHVARALDVGSGCGAQAIAAASNADEVVATDVNGRALAFAAFNAALNGISEIETRVGSLLDPVAGERFGLVMCNAPYVISPEDRFAFRDSGMSGDGVSELLVREVPALLDDGGTATLVLSWLSDEDDWAAAPRSWIEGAGCDTWVIGGPTLDPLGHAAKWTNFIASDQEAFGEALDEWAGYIQGLGASHVTEGVVILRKRASGRPWFRADRLPRGAPKAAAGQLDRVFAGRDAVEGGTPLLELSPVITDAARVTETVAPSEGGPQTLDLRLSLADGLLFETAVDPAYATALLSLDGTISLGAALAANGIEAEDAEPFLRELLDTGFLDVRG